MTTNPPLPAPSSNLDAKYLDYTSTRRDYWNHYAGEIQRWDKHRSFYQRKLGKIFSFLVPPNMRVLEIGSGTGEVLAALNPAYGVGVDFSPAMVQEASRRHPKLRWIQADAHDCNLGETFDYIILSDLVNDVWDVQQVLETAHRHAHPTTKLILNFYSNLWHGPRRLAELFGLARPQLPQNWMTREDLSNLLYLAGWESLRSAQEILCPFNIPLLAPLANRYLVKLWPFQHLGLTNIMVGRPLPVRPANPEPIVSVIVAARNEEGNIANIFDRVPQMGGGTELIFVEGNSKDDTWGAIEREIARRPEVNCRLYKQGGKGKGDAVRKGFNEATGEVLMILDADLTVPPEDLPRFYEAWRSGKAEFVNGVRLVYPMEENAMRFFNLIGNKFFSMAFSWLLSQFVKDTLCGTKVLSKSAYQVIADNRAYFRDFDPFGDFDLIFGAAKYNLKILDLPVRYRERVYGKTNINRWSHGVVLLRMVIYASLRIKFI